MSRSLLLAALVVVLGAAFVGASRTHAKDAPHRVVFELTSDDPKTWESLMNNIENLRVALGAATAVEVVAHGKGLALLTSKSAGAPLERMTAASKAGVTFAACENTMKRQGVKKEDLLPFTVVVDAGIAEIVRKQEAGWSYVRTGS